MFTCMDMAFINSVCEKLPGAVLSHPADGDLHAWKVGGKIFACFSSADTGVSVKTPDVETSELIRAAGHGVRARYFHRSWVHIPWNLVAEDEVIERLCTSYRIIRAGLVRKVRDTLPAFE